MNRAVNCENAVPANKVQPKQTGPANWFDREATTRVVRMPFSASSSTVTSGKQWSPCQWRRVYPSSGRGFQGGHHDDFNLRGQRRAVPAGVLLPDRAVLVWVDEAVKRATIGGGLLINGESTECPLYARMTSSWLATVDRLLDALVSPPGRFVFKAINLGARARPRKPS